MRVRNMTNPSGNEVKNQFIITGNGVTTFQSYDSQICDWDGSQLKLYSDWDYSRTTLKFFKWFLEDYTRIPYESKSKFDRNLDELIKEGKIILMY